MSSNHPSNLGSRDLPQINASVLLVLTTPQIWGLVIRF